MACGLRVVASPVGVNAQLVERDRNGLLAVTPNDWYSALTLLRREPAHGWRLGLVGRAKIQEGYTTESAVARLVSLLPSLPADNPVSERERATRRTIGGRGLPPGQRAAQAADLMGG
jgi:hypothetical protein